MFLRIKSQISKFNRKKRELALKCDQCGIEFYIPFRKTLIYKTHHFHDERCKKEALRKGNVLDKKTRQTCIERYGVDVPIKNVEVKSRFKETCIKLYGVSHHLFSIDVRKKIGDTCMQRFGALTPFHSADVQVECKRSLLANHGVRAPIQHPEFRQKIIKTNQERYGSNWVLGSKSIRQRIISTCIERYGVPNPMQSTFIKEKIDWNLIREHVIMTMTGLTLDEWKKYRTEFYMYRRNVYNVTSKQHLKSLSGFESRSVKGMHLDHMFSIKQGFEQGIDSKIIGNIVNLSFIPARDNIRKRVVCSITLDELVTRYNAALTTLTA